MNWFRNQKTLTKLMLGFGFFALLMGVIGYQGISGMSKVNVMMDQVYSKEMAGVTAAKEIVASVLEMSRVARQAIIDTDDQSLHGDEEDYTRAVSDMTAKFLAAESVFHVPEGKRLLAETRKDAEDYSAQIREVIRHAVAHDTKTAVDLIKKAHVASDRTLDAANRTAAFKEKAAMDYFQASQSTYSSTRNSVIVIISGGIVLAIVLGFFIAQMIVRPLAEMVSTANGLAGGHLDQKVEYHSKDEVGSLAQAFRTMIQEFSGAVNETAEILGRLARRDLTARMSSGAKGDFEKIEKSLNTAADNLQQALTEVRHASTQVASTAQQLSSASQQIAAGAQEQASSLEETSATLEELTATVKQNADSARQANQLAAGAREAAEKGGSVMNTAVAAMNEINTASSRIAEIITTIDEIAFQTNLLALNAAVEAARAGEQGRGFAVVASEVRNLAQRSASAAKEIKGLIQDSVRKVENGSQLVNDSGKTLTEIVLSVKRVTDIVAEIAAASQEQATGVEQVAKATSQMDQVTQQNSAQTEEMSSTAEELSATAATLQDLVGRFMLEEHSSNLSVTPRQAVNAKPKPRISTSKSAARPAQTSLVALAHQTGSGFEEF